MTNKHHTTLYVGVTNNLIRRAYEHKEKINKGFTSKYNLTKLIYFEDTTDVYQAICREKQLKNWHRQWKINLIKNTNPNFYDLASDWY